MAELTVKEWIEEINRGLEYRKLYGLESSWASLEAMFYHVQSKHQAPNLIYSTGDALMSTMSVPLPYVTTKAKRQEFLAPSRLLESIDNDLIDVMSMTDEVELGVLSAYLWGPAIFKIGYDSEKGWDPSFDVGLMHKLPLGMSMTQFDKHQNRIEYNNVDPGMPWFKRVLPHDFVVPWGTPPDLSYAPWCAHRTVRHIDDIKGDVKYNTRGLRPVMSVKDFVESYKKVPAVYRTGQDVTKSMGWNETGESEYVELWEIHDRRTGKIYVIATGHDAFLRNEQDYLQLNGLPFVSFGLVPRARTFWTTSDAYYLQQAQNEAEDIALQASKHRKASVLKFMYQEDALENDELDNFLSNETGIGIKISGEKPINEAIAFSQAPPDLQTGPAMENVRRDAREMTGFSRNQLGEYEQTGRRTATEAKVVQDASSLRMDRRQGCLAKVYVNAFRKINPIIQQYWQAPRVAELMGQDGAQQFLTFTGDDLKGEFKYSLGFSLGSMESLQQRRQNALQMYAMLRQDPLMNPMALARYLNFSFNDPEFTTLFQPGVLNGQIEALSAIQTKGQALGLGGGGMDQGGSGSVPQGGKGQGASGNGSSTNRTGSVQTPGLGARN